MEIDSPGNYSGKSAEDDTGADSDILPPAVHSIQSLRAHLENEELDVPPANATISKSTKTVQRYARRGEGIHVPEHVHHSSDIQQELREMAGQIHNKTRREQIMEAIQNVEINQDTPYPGRGHLKRGKREAKKQAGPEIFARKAEES